MKNQKRLVALGTYGSYDGRVDFGLRYEGNPGESSA